LLKAPPKPVSIVPPRPEGGRTELKVLDAYLDRIRLWSSAPSQSSTIPFESADVEVGPWTAHAIHRFCNTPDPIKGEVEELVTQGVAVMAKCRSDLLQGDDDTANLTQTFARQAEMMLGVAVGTVVVRELQKKGNALLAHGKNIDAGELNQFQHDVRHAVNDVRNALRENEKRRANEMAAAFLGEVVRPAVEPEPEAPVAAPPEPPSRPHPEPRRGRRAEAPARPRPTVFKVESPRPARVRGFLIPIAVFVALICLGIWGLTRNTGTPIRGDASESLIAAMSETRGITEVQDRMPYVLLTVHADFWASSGDAEHDAWIEELSRTVERHGYTGLVVRSTSGVPLAEWVKDRGVRFANRE
jgi:hypothetical protein